VWYRLLYTPPQSATASLWPQRRDKSSHVTDARKPITDNIIRVVYVCELYVSGVRCRNAGGRTYYVYLSSTTRVRLRARSLAFRRNNREEVRGGGEYAARNEIITERRVERALGRSVVYYYYYYDTDRG